MNRPLNKYFDHTLLKPDATEADIVRLCQEAKEHEFYAVCVNSSYVALAKRQLLGSQVAVAAVVGFPLGACLTEAKAFETELACRQGAAEIDMVLPVGALKNGRMDEVCWDISQVVSAAKGKALVKVILETCLLTDQEIAAACQLAEKAKADFVKTSTGFSSGGAEARHIALMKKTVGDRLRIKASGGIRDLAAALEMIDAGADRIGASASVKIMEEYKNTRL